MPETPRSYHDYPESLFRILEHFKSSPSPFKVSVGDRNSRLAYKKNFYRFRKRLGEATSSGDTYAESLWRVARNISVSVSPESISFYYDILADFEPEPLSKSFHTTLDSSDEEVQGYDTQALEDIIREKKKE